MFQIDWLVEEMQQQQMSYPGMNVGPPGVVCFPVPVQSRIYDRYSKKQSIGLGIAQVVIGALCAIFNLVILVTSRYDGGMGEAGHGFWCGALVSVSCNAAGLIRIKSES